jgi:hypothetical protein
MAELASYILTLQDSHPIAPKAPQGIKMESNDDIDSLKITNQTYDSLATASK